MPKDGSPDLRLMARSESAPEKAVYFLTDAIAACGGQMLSRRFHADGSAVVRCEFLRSRCVDIYEALLGAGVHLSRRSHFRLAELWQCTHALPKEGGDQRVVLELEVLQASPQDGLLRMPRKWLRSA